MTKFLVSDDKPDGFKLEDILVEIRKDVLHRCSKIEDDHRPEALHVMDNNMRILGHLSDAIKLATDSTRCPGVVTSGATIVKGTRMVSSHKDFLCQWCFSPKWKPWSDKNTTMVLPL